MNSDFLKINRYKECVPEETVKKIVDILSMHGIITERKSEYRSSIDTNSLRLVIKGTDIGTNGKGMKKSYALASAYAEFMERLENLHLDSFTELIPDRKYGFYLFPDEKIIHIDKLIEQKDPFLMLYFNKTKLKKEEFLKIHTLDFKKINIKESFISVPFWDYKENREVYLPYTIYRPWYGSNGMCSGNTTEEALVQGISEIIERIVMRRLITEKISFPNIPEDYIKRYPCIYERYKKIKENSSHYVKLIDCSFGGKYPVAGLLLIEKNTGNYGMKLGAHPNYEIAIERTLTEASQGKDIFDFSKNSFLDFSNENVFSESNLAKCFMTGEGQYPYQFFNMECQYEFCEPKDTSKMDNKQLLAMLLDEFQKDGHHVLVRNVSYLGFPAFHIIIPGLSETGDVSKEDYEMIHLLNDSINLFRNPELVNEKNSIEVMKILEHFSYQQYLSFFIHTQDNHEIPFEYAGESVHYYQAMLSAALGKYGESINYLTLISQTISKGYITDRDKECILSLMYYLSARQLMNTHSEAMKYIRAFFEDSLCRKLDECFGNQENDKFNSTLFRKMVYQYRENKIDTFVAEIMDKNRYAMIKNMPQQNRIG